MARIQNSNASRRKNAANSVMQKYARGHLDDGVHAVDVAEERQHEQAQPPILEDTLHRLPQAAERVADQVLGTLLVVRLVHVANERDAKRHPPRSRDEKRYLHAISMGMPIDGPPNTTAKHAMNGTHEPM